MIIIRNLLIFIFIGWLLIACSAPQPAAETQALLQMASPTRSPTQALVTNQGAPGNNQADSTPTAQIATVLPQSSPSDTPAPVEVVIATPACSTDKRPTRPDMEGPYFLAGSPEKASLIEPGMGGTPVTITGYVMSTKCEPQANVKIEFWQADANGEYDLQGYRLRGHVFSDDTGRYQIETIIPAPYEIRPRHIHVMVQPPGQPSLTTQLYFPGDSPYPELTVALSDDTQTAVAVFDFIVELR